MQPKAITPSLRSENPVVGLVKLNGNAKISKKNIKTHL